MSKEFRTGAAFALAAYTVWGVNPVYFKWLSTVTPVELLCHRILWSVLLLAIITIAMRRLRVAQAVLENRRQLGWLGVSSALISLNWLVYTWAVQADRIVETTLGYFINPLLSVVLGVVFFRESINRLQSIAIGIAAVGVANEVLAVGVVPWVALTLALSFALYGFVRKRVGVDSVIGLAIETSMLAPFALAALAVLYMNDTLAFGRQGLAIDLWLVAAGAITSFPLVCFAAAAMRLPLSVLGIFQYLSPSLALVIAIVVYGEPFTPTRAITFGCIWTALVLFSMSAFRSDTRRVAA